MVTIAAGGGTSAVAASTHASCRRFRGTDPLITGVSRRSLARRLGWPDVSGGVPEARWMRAMTFERLVHDDRFVSELLTRGIGQLGLPRPAGVRHVACGRDAGASAAALSQAHRAAVRDGHASMLSDVAVPLAGFTLDQATPVLPDFVIVAPSRSDSASCLVVGDAKDYERVRGGIDDGRILKGFIQVALGAESFARWDGLPTGMTVHRHGILAVPRNAYLRPEALTEDLADHRAEVRTRLAERAALAAGPLADGVLDESFAQHLEADFDPGRCTTCSLFGYCRSVLRTSANQEDLLVEIGVTAEQRAGTVPILQGGDGGAGVPQRTARAVSATLTGTPVVTSARRSDPVGRRGAVYVAVVKSDAAALGVHGVAVSTDTGNGPGQWESRTFIDPQSATSRRAVLAAIGGALDRVLASSRGRPAATAHVVVPDAATADLLVALADSLAGVEISRLRWQRDLDMGREALTFDGEPARLPEPLEPAARLAVSFLLEADRARAFRLRNPLVNLTDIVRRHVVPGGPLSDAGRLDYLTTWWGTDVPLDHRTVSDEIASREHTPGARMTNQFSNRVHRATRDGAHREYARLVEAELDYKTATMRTAVDLLAQVPESALAAVHGDLEARAQEVWRRRYRLQASDLTRFSLTSWFWRNQQVDELDHDGKLADTLTVLGGHDDAADAAVDAGNRAVFLAHVETAEPLTIRTTARRITEGMRLLLLHHAGEPEIEHPNVTVRSQKSNIRFDNLSLAPVEATADPRVWAWSPALVGELEAGQKLILADVDAIGTALANGTSVTLGRPGLDENSAPKPSCQEGDYAADPQTHRWCCRSHEEGEAEYADQLAERRARGELNPQVWPPVIDLERFDLPGDAGIPASVGAVDTTMPEGATLDDLE